jgi:glucose-1-phosphate thymidylyltransferase
MKALLLAAGYATRLRPLTDTRPKPLLAVGGRPIADWILDRIAACPAVDGVQVVTNAVYAPAFEEWAQGRSIVVHDDGTSTNEGRLGALGDIRLAVERGGLAAEPLLVIAADNLFEFSLADYVAFWAAKEPAGSAIAVHRLADPSLASLYGVVELGDDDRLVGMEEKPAHPRSELVSTATYIFTPAHLALLEGYLEGGNAPDPPGAFISWLYAREYVYGFRFAEEWLDIGELSQLLEADNRYRRRAGLEPRDEYVP